MLRAVAVLGACVAMVACDSPSGVGPCTAEGRSTVLVEVRKPSDQLIGTVVPAQGVTVRMEPEVSSNCYPAVTATTDASGIARLDGFSHLAEWRVFVTAPSGYVIPASASTGIPVALPLDTVRATLHFAPNDLEMTFYVSNQLVDCVGAAAQKCMLVKTTPGAAYEFFYEPIEGFTFEPGYLHTLRVVRRRVGLPAADGNLYSWHLVRIVSKTNPDAPPTAPMLQFLQEAPAQIMQAIATNQDLLPRNPTLVAQIQAKITLLQKPGLATEINDLSYFAERTATSSDGRTMRIMTVFTADTMRAGATGSINYLYQALPRLEQFMNLPFPVPLIRIWYGFALGNSGGGGWINMEDRGTYEGRTPSTRLPFDAILAHELAHSYVGNEALTQFLELYIYNTLLNNSTDVSQWTFTRDYVPDASANANVHALLDIYRLIGRDAMMNAYRAIYPLHPPYGSALSTAVRDAFVAAVPQSARTQAAAKLATITF